MPDDIVNTRDAFDSIFEDIAEEEATAAAEALKKKDDDDDDDDNDSNDDDSNDDSDKDDDDSDDDDSNDDLDKDDDDDSDDDDSNDDSDKDDDQDSNDDDSDDDDSENKEKKLDKSEKTEYTEDQSEKRKITVDGEEIEVDADTAFDNYQRKTASDRRFKEASTSKKETEVFWENVLKNPGETLVDRIVDEFCAGDRVQARAVVVQNLLEWMEPERKAAAIEDEKEKDLFRREHEMEIRQQEADRRESVRAAKQEREAEEEFDTNLRKELLAGFRENSLPEDQIPIWKTTTDLLKNLQTELPSSMQDDIVAIRAELVKNARRIVGEVAKIREQAIKDLVPTLSKDELVKRFPDLVEALKTERIAKVKKKRSTKRKGNVAKQQEQKQKSREKVTPQKIISTEELFRDME